MPKEKQRLESKAASLAEDPALRSNCCRDRKPVPTPSGWRRAGWATDSPPSTRHHLQADGSRPRKNEKISWWTERMPSRPFEHEEWSPIDRMLAEKQPKRRHLHGKRFSMSCGIDRSTYLRPDRTPFFSFSSRVGVMLFLRLRAPPHQNH